VKTVKFGQSELRVSEIWLGTTATVSLSPDILCAIERVHARFPNPAP